MTVRPSFNPFNLRRVYTISLIMIWLALIIISHFVQFYFDKIGFWWEELTKYNNLVIEFLGQLCQIMFGARALNILIYNAPLAVVILRVKF